MRDLKESFIIFLIALALALALFAYFPDWARACGLKPLPPLMPLGCTTQWAVCIDGKWVWVCQ